MTDKNTNFLFSGLVLAMKFFCYNANVQYNNSFKEEDMILPVLNIICGSKNWESLRKIGKVIAPKWAEVP